MNGLPLVLFVFACGPGKPECVPPSRSLSGIVTELAFTRIGDTPGVVEGFNLDARAGNDAASCKQPDYDSPAGDAGIDNQLAVLLPIVDGLTGGALDAAVQSAVNNGQLLLAFTVEGIDDLCSDNSVTLRVQRVSGVPLLGADGRIDPGQTFDLIDDGSETTLKASIKDRVVDAGPATIPFPVAVLDAQFTARFYAGRVRLALGKDGGMDGLVGGGLDRAELMTSVRGFTIREELMQAIDSAVSLFSDLEPDAAGSCQQLSAAVKIAARSAFVLR